ncbi:F-box domain-containing protein [Mycena sanguinolenta]|uniref:F-box domain-containing protein n=1 Tax=Mycena sanguinolenta TaxID=230812 RepID=A0A8H7DIB4_9AGAR|nr:F-box domain-containing protein [Mycena sanguinolenta]
MSTSKPTETAAILPSGINRFPAELLVEIFALCWRSFTPRFAEIYTTPSGEVCQDNSTASYKTEIARLAHAPLLAVSQVCMKWRAIALGTSFLWCDVELDCVLWDRPDHSTTALGLLESTLTRGRSSPLNISLTEGAYPFPAPVFAMLAMHSHRWQTFTCPSSFIDAFQGIRDKLPRLQKLYLDAGPDEAGSLDMWGSMPNLTSLVLVADVFAYDRHKLPLKQLRELECTTLDRDDTESALSVMSLLPTATEFRLAIQLFGNTDEAWLEMNSVTADISGFFLQLLEDFACDYSLEVLQCILNSITLPLLTRFELESYNYPRCPLLWPHRAFLALSTRSSLNSTLQTLEIYDVHITEQQLLECLSDLPSLERLAVSDHQPVALIPERAGVGASEVLITDSLLSRLTPVADSSCLVPRLSSLGCQTLMRFDDRALLALAVSRLDEFHLSQNSGRFDLELSWLPGHGRRLDDAVFARLDALRTSTNRRLTFRMSAAEDEWIKMKCVESSGGTGE